MEEKLYQVKDIMDLFGISRDTIKYYEKQGMITPARNDNGYRMFDVFNVEKLKKVLDLRDLGFSVKEVTEMLKDEKKEVSGERLIHLRKQTEEEIRILHHKLEKIRIFERNYHDNKRYMDGFNVEYNIDFCLDCPMIENRDKCTYFVRNVDVGLLDDDGNITGWKQGSIVLNHCDFRERCQKCVGGGVKGKNCPMFIVG